MQWKLHAGYKVVITTNYYSNKKIGDSILLFSFKAWESEGNLRFLHISYKITM